MTSTGVNNGSTPPVKPRKSLFRPISITNLAKRASNQTSSRKQTTAPAPAKIKLSINTSTVTADADPELAATGALSPRSVPLPPSPAVALEGTACHTGMHANAIPDAVSLADESDEHDHKAALRSSLAMLDTQCQFLHELASPRSSRHLSSMLASQTSTSALNTTPSSSLAHHRDLIAVSEVAEDADSRPKLSPRSSSLPAAAHHTRASSEARAQQLWTATGLQEQENLDGPSKQRPASTIQSNDLLIDPDTRLRNETSSSSNSDTVDISEFPSYSDLQAFAGGEDATPAISAQLSTSKRASDLLDFPLPPTVDAVPPTFEDESDVSTDEVSVPGLLDADNTSDLFAQLSKLAQSEQTRNGPTDERVHGLGLFDATAEAGDERADDLQSDQSSHYTQSSHDASTHMHTSAETSFSASKEDVATYQTALVVPHRFSALPATPPLDEAITALPDEVRHSLKDSPPPAMRAVASLQSLPDILRTQPTPQAKPTSESMAEQRRASFLPGQTLQASPTPIAHVSLPPSPGVEVVSMRPQSMARRPSSTLEAHSPDSSRSPSISPTPSRKSSTDRPTSRVRDSCSPAEMYMRPTSALRLEGDFGFPLWDASPASSKKSLNAAPPSPRKTKEATSTHPGLPPKSPSQNSAPKSPLAAPPLTAEPASPPPPPPASLSKRMSFGMLKKRKSEQALAPKAGESATTTTNNTSKIVRRSVSTPKLSGTNKADSNKSRASSAVPPSPKSPSSPKVNNKKRFSMFLPQVFGGTNRDDVPPVPSLSMPLSAPPTTVAFTDEKQIAASKAMSEVTQSDASSARPSDEIEVLDPSSAVELQPPPSPGLDDARMSLRAFIDSSSEKDQVMPRPVRSSSYFATSLESPVFPPVSPAIAPASPVGLSPVPFGELTNQPHLVAAPVKDNVGKARHENDHIHERVASPVLSDEGPFGVQEVIVFPVSTPSLDQQAWHADEESTSSSEGENATDSENEDGVVTDSEKANRSSEDDKPLSQIPGALTAQKSLRQASRKSSPSSKSKRSEGKRDPFKFDKLVGTVDERQSRSEVAGTTFGHSLLPQTDEAVERRSASLTRSPSAPLDPVVANSALTIDSPDVALQSLPTSTSSSQTNERVKSARSVSSRSRDASPARAGLMIDPAVAQKHALLTAPAPRSPSLTVPTPTSRSGSMSSSRHHVGASSAPPSRQPSQRRPSNSSSSMQRSRSNTGASTSSHGHSAVMRAMTTTTASTTNSPSNSPRIGTASASAPAQPTVEHKIFVGDHKKKIRVQVSSATTCADVVTIAKKQGLLTFGSDAEGGFSLWEICRVLGVERPIREYEFVADVVKSWDHDTNILIIKRTTLWPLLSASLRIQPAALQGAYAQIQVKKGKWTKRFLQIRDNAVWHGKSEKPKDAVVLCQLSSFDVFFVASHVIGELKAPKPFVFALKSKLPRAHYENESEYCHFVSVKTPEELTKWVKAVVEARNPLVRNENSVISVKATAPHAHLFNSVANAIASQATTANNSPTSTPSLSRNPSLRPKPSILSVPSAPLPSSGGLPSPASTGAVDRPDPRLWAAMSDSDRQAWLREAQKEARQEGKTLLDFSAETTSSSAQSSLRR
ncbi:hypothetical protein ACM66B_000791 [Microbotryomycetes sp. NB124-2]